MQNTSNFSFLLPEGTDIVNPLVDMNPNWSSIDGLLKTCADRTVCTTTATKTGTVFAITRSSALGARPINQVIRFTAPDTFHDGDTMTVDGTAVTLQLCDGTTPGEGCFVIGCDVIGIKTGAVVTLLVKGSDPVYTASDIDMANGDSVQDAIDKIGSVIRVVEGGAYAAGDTWVIPSAAQDLIDSGKHFLVEASFYYGDTASSARLTKVTTRGFGRHVALTLNRSDIQTGLVNISASSFAAYGFDIAHAPKLYDLYLFPIAAY